MKYEKQVAIKPSGEHHQSSKITTVLLLFMLSYTKHLTIELYFCSVLLGARSSFRQLLPLARPRSCPSLPPASTNTLCEATFLLKFMCDWEDIMY